MKDYTTLINSAPLVMVEFYATWCPHCQRMMPVIAQIRELVGDNAQIYQLDIDRNQETASELGVEATPTFIIYRAGETRRFYELNRHTPKFNIQKFKIIKGPPLQGGGAQ